MPPLVYVLFGLVLGIVLMKTFEVFAERAAQADAPICEQKRRAWRDPTR